MNDFQIDLDGVRRGYRQFIGACQTDSKSFRLTPRADSSPYALCFAVFGLHLLKDDFLQENKECLALALCENVKAMRQAHKEVPRHKPYRQLLTFTLSALSVLDCLAQYTLEELVLEQLPDDLSAELTGVGALKGVPQSGNQAMFLAIFLIYARDWLGLDMNKQIQQWVDLHLQYINKFGFWVDKHGGMNHLHFQNGYHQYEIFDYLGVPTGKEKEAVLSVCSLADSLGHFAPYPGGGGCYDYDATFILTHCVKANDKEVLALLNKTARTILNEQTTEGGFAESHYIRPYSLKNMLGMMTHVLQAIKRPALFKERARYAVALQRPRHSRIHTHWSRYSRAWNEGDLWDSWFRMLTVARIQVALYPERANDWGFINFPGIGFHSCLRKN